MDLQKMVDAMNEQGRMERSKYHVTLEKLISRLKEVDPTLPVHLDTGGTIERPDSYRGFYSDLAFEPSDGAITATDLLNLCQDAFGRTFEGYKGGNHTMGPDTPLWVSEYGENSGIAITGVQDAGDCVVLITKNTHDEDE